jgi:hypothetical protein
MKSEGETEIAIFEGKKPIGFEKGDELCDDNKLPI